MKKYYYVASPNAFRGLPGNPPRRMPNEEPWAKKTLSEAISHAELLLEREQAACNPPGDGDVQGTDYHIIVQVVGVVRRKPRRPVKRDYTFEAVR